MSAQGVMVRNLPITPCPLTLLYIICKLFANTQGDFAHVFFQYLVHYFYVLLRLLPHLMIMVMMIIINCCLSFGCHDNNYKTALSNG
jgi:hypothetical protein